MRFHYLPLRWDKQAKYPAAFKKVAREKTPGERKMAKKNR